jgi:hypothetical protein
MHKKYPKGLTFFLPLLFLASLQSSKAQAAGLADVENIDVIIRNCVVIARSQIEEKTNRPHFRSRFEAFLNGDTIQMFGTDRERFEFHKCMGKMGVPLETSR